MMLGTAAGLSVGHVLIGTLLGLMAMIVGIYVGNILHVAFE
jgi:hypothetical protein